MIPPRRIKIRPALIKKFDKESSKRDTIIISNIEFNKMEFIVEIEKSRMRLDKYLTEKVPGISRVKIQTAIKDGAVTVNNSRALKSSQKLNASDRVSIPEEIIMTPTEETGIIPDSKIALDIVYEDDDVVVINKPAGLMVHPTLSVRSGTLVNALLDRYPEIVNVGENPLRPGIVHRLDKNTSGLIIVAKNQNSFLFLKEQFLSKKIQKTYLAIVCGVPPKNEGEINYDIRPSKMSQMKKVAVKRLSEPQIKSRREAKTLYKILKNFKGFTLVEAKPLTGRTHQIRVHLSAIGCPILGDHLYGSKSDLAARQMLHAEKLTFTTPNGKALSLEIPPPEDFKKILETLSS